MNIQAVEIRDYWQDVKAPIQEIMNSLPWTDFYIEDVFAQCVQGAAVLFVDTDVPRGTSFFIAKIKGNDVGQTIMFLWLAYSASSDTAAQSHKAIEEIALRAGCSAVEFTLGSPALAEYAAGFGYDQQMVTVRKTLGTE
jgi:hypothetical protein